MTAGAALDPANTVAGANLLVSAGITTAAEAEGTDMTGVYLNYLWVSVAIVVVMALLGWWGWRSRKRRQAHVPAPEPVPAALLEQEPLAAAEGMVIGTVKASHYLDRIAVHGLGIRTNGLLEVHPEGLAVLRSGAENFLIRRDQLNAVRTDRGVVGKFVEADGAVIFGWRLGDEDVETAFRARSAAGHEQLISEIKKVAGLGSHAKSDGRESPKGTNRSNPPGPSPGPSTNPPAEHPQIHPDNEEHQSP